MTCGLFAAAWNPRGSAGTSRNSGPNRSSAAHFGIKAQERKAREPFHPSLHTQPFESVKNPSTRGRGGASTARVNTHQTPGDKLKEQQMNRIKYLADQRQFASIETKTNQLHPRSYSFTLDPNPSFKPFLLDSNMNQSDEEYEYKLWDPYSEGLFHQFKR